MTNSGKWQPPVGIGYVLTFQTAIVASAQSAPVLAPLAASAIGVEPDRVGYFTAVVFAAALFSSNGVAGIVARFGSFTGAALSLAAAAAGVACLALSASPWLAVIGAVLIGVGYGPVNPIGSRLLMRFASRRRQNLIFSLKQSSVSLGGAVAGIALPGLALAFGWRVALGVAAIFPLAVAVLAWQTRDLLGDDADPQASIRFVGPFRIAASMLSDPALRRLSLSIFTFSMTQFGFMSVYVTLLWRWPGLAPETAAALLSLTLAASIAGRLFWGWRADTGNPQGILASLALAGSVVLFAMLFMSESWPLWATVAESLALGFLTMSWSGVLLSEVAQLGAARNGLEGTLRTTAGSMVFGYLGGLLGPAILSLSVGVSGSYAAGVAFLGAALAVNAIALFTARHKMEEND